MAGSNWAERAVDLRADDLSSVHARMQSLMSERVPTEFGRYILGRMARHDPPLSQADVAQRAGAAQSTISRWIFEARTPEPRLLRRLAVALDVDYGELLDRAGHGRPVETPAPTLHPIAAEIDRMLDPGTSPLPDADREALGSFLDRAISPYRQLMKRRRSA